MDTRTTTAQLDVSIPVETLDHAADLIRATRRPAREPNPYIVRWPYASVYPRFVVSPPDDGPDTCPYCGHEHHEEAAS